jgi:hypothetical protein
MATQTTNTRKAAGQKAAATRKRNAAKRSRSARKAAETRARAEANAIQSLAFRGQEIGQRAVDLTFGAAAETRDRLDDARQSVTSRTGRDRLTRRVRGSVKSAQRRGAKVRRDATRTTRRRRREAERRIQRARREGERRAKSLRRDAERRVKSLRS